jgi:hypothetical protein
VVKISLLMPADPAMLRTLQPLAEVASNSLVTDLSMGPSLAAWRSFSLGLMAYRMQDYSGAEKWCEKSMAFENGNVVRAVNLQLVRAMTDYQLGKKETARNELALARKQIGSHFDNDWELGDGGKGFWFDWLFARILLEEAAALINRHGG